MVSMDNIPEDITDVKNIEGFDMLNKSKQEEIEAKFREQKKVSTCLNTFYSSKLISHS